MIIYGTNKEDFETYYSYTVNEVNISDINDEGIYTTDTVVSTIFNFLIQWKKEFINKYHRVITINEMDSMWFRNPPTSRFDKQNRSNWVYSAEYINKIVQLQYKVNDVFRKEMGRDISILEMKLSYTLSFKKDGELREEFKENFKAKVPIGICVVCGEPVYASDYDILHHAGEITLSFGYGSKRDTECGKGYVHDFCSFKLDQEIFNRRLFWFSPIGPVYPLDFEKSDENNWVFNEKKSDTSDPWHDIRATLEDLENI